MRTLSSEGLFIVEQIILALLNSTADVSLRALSSSILLGENENVFSGDEKFRTTVTDLLI